MTSHGDTRFDVLIIGAGLSGVCAACHLARECPELSVAMLERRERIGGTWDLFRYPGVRSDSDIFSFGFGFRPWHDFKMLADGPAIRDYVRDTAREYGVEKNIHFGLRTLSADWSRDEALWRVTTRHEASGEERVFTARFLIGATGYYNYDEGHRPPFPGEASFGGRIVHPQHWPEDLDYAGKRVVVIGSGATAVTLVPAMSERAAHVTMLQRSPSYIFSVPAFDQLSALLRRFLPAGWVYAMGRKRNIAIQRALYIAARRWPDRVRRFLLQDVRKRLKDPDADMRHFTPDYAPWDERLCAVPDGDLFKAINEGRASVVTDRIETFTETGIRLASGQTLEADIIVTATGLQLQLLGGMDIRVDGERGDPASLMTYKAVMMEGVPNFAAVLGYTNAPWTLKADIASRYVCRLLRHMRQHGYAVAVPQAPAGMVIEDESILDALQSGYVKRARHVMPRQGRELPWRVLNHYGRDRKMLLEEPVDDGCLVFSRSPEAERSRAA